MQDLSSRFLGISVTSIAEKRSVATNDDMELGARIAKLLDEREQSQSWLARKTGIDQSALSKVISGKQRLYADQLIVIAEALGTTPNELLGVQSPREPGAESERTILAMVRSLGEQEAMRRLLAVQPPLFGPASTDRGQSRTGTK